MRTAPLLIALSGLYAAHQAVAQPPQYPKLGAYRAATSAGAPYINPDRSLNMTTIRNDTRFDVVVVHSTPFTLHRRDVLQALRRLNPTIKLYAYIQGGLYWCNPHPAYGDTTNDFPWMICQLVQSSNGILWAQDGSSLGINYASMPFVLAFVDFIATQVADTGRIRAAPSTVSRIENDAIKASRRVQRSPSVEHALHKAKRPRMGPLECLTIKAPA